MPKIEPMLGPRRHRKLTGFAGIVLFACMFLPAVKGCGEPVYPVEMPMFLHPYLFGLAFAIAAVATTTRAMRVSILIIRVLAWLAVAGGVVCIPYGGLFGMVLVMVGLGLVAAIGASGFSERRAAVATIVVGAASTIWFGFWASSSDALIGAYVSLLSSIGLLTGGVAWLGELATLPEPPIVLPRAIARRHE